MRSRIEPVAKVRAAPLAEVDFTPFGRHVRLAEGGAGVVSARGDGWTDLATKHPLLGMPPHLGLTVGSPAPFVTRRMERHLLTEEAILCTDAPIVLAVAPASAADAPAAADVRAVVLEPGDVVVLAEGTWHDACHGVRGEARYYWLAREVAGDTVWVDLVNGPVEVTC